MKVELNATEARVIGCLLEKQVTTPDQYPLSLNALLAACNQRSNREPVTGFGEGEVQAAIDRLTRKHLVLERAGFGSRVPKYHQLFCNTEFGSLRFDAQELAIVCELLLRGPQTPGELRSRAGRMAPFADVGEVEAALERLAGRDSEPCVARLAREPGRREARWMQLFTGPAPAVDPGRPGDAARDAEHAGAPALAAADALEARVARLEEAVEALQRALAALSGAPT